MSKIRVSVIIPTYNCGKYICAALDSVLAQTHPPDEIIIVDDGSTDDTRAVVSGYSDPRIHYIAAPHRGTAATRNNGIDVASGQYLAFLDADDLWRPAMLERQLAVMESDESLVCSFTNFARFVDGTGEVLPAQFEFCPELASVPVTQTAAGDALLIEADAFVQFIGFEEIPAYTQCMLFRRALIAEMRQNESLRRCQDLEYVARAFMRGKVAFTREVLADIRRHESNATKDTSLMGLDKLWALLALRTAVDTPARRAALNDRLVKAWIDAATALIRAGRRSEGLEHYLKAFTAPGSGRRKIKGTARVAYELATSVRGGGLAVTPDATGSPTPTDAAWQTSRRH